MSLRYQFTTGAKFAIFTFQGCTVHVSGKMEVMETCYDYIVLNTIVTIKVEPYTSQETPMMIYLNTHAALEQLRIKAEKDNTRGPICMLVRIFFGFIWIFIPLFRLAPLMWVSPQ